MKYFSCLGMTDRNRAEYPWVSCGFLRVVVRAPNCKA